MWGAWWVLPPWATRWGGGGGGGGRAGGRGEGRARGCSLEPARSCCCTLSRPAPPGCRHPRGPPPLAAAPPRPAAAPRHSAASASRGSCPRADISPGCGHHGRGELELYIRGELERGLGRGRRSAHMRRVLPPHRQARSCTCSGLGAAAAASQGTHQFYTYYGLAPWPLHRLPGGPPTADDLLPGQCASARRNGGLCGPPFLVLRWPRGRVASPGSKKQDRPFGFAVSRFPDR
jgi:hypothetical protein